MRKTGSGLGRRALGVGVAMVVAWLVVAAVACSPTAPAPAGATARAGDPTAPPATAAPAATSTVVPTATASPPTPTATPTTQAMPYAAISTASGSRVLVKLEVADTPEARGRGLSRRPSLPEDSGMLFVFESEQQAAFWMKDTTIPLSIAFISSGGEIVEIRDMQPLSEEIHRPSRQYRYALEVNQGFFRRNGVGVGDRVEIRLGGE